MGDLYFGDDLGLSEDIEIGTVLVNTSSTYKYFNMAGQDFRYAVIQYKNVSNQTLTLEASADNRRTADGDATWFDVTDAYSGVASATTDGAWIIDTPVPFFRMRVKMYNTNTTNSCNLKILRSR